MITRGLSCDRVEFGHFWGGGQMTPLIPRWLRACIKEYIFLKSLQAIDIDFQYRQGMHSLCLNIGHNQVRLKRFP